MGIYPKIKLIVNCDSFGENNRHVFEMLFDFLASISNMHGFKFDVKEWKALNPEDIGKQKDNNSCGVYACLNAYSMINLVDINVSEADLSAIRCWITLKAVQVQNTAKLRTKTKSFKKADVEYNFTVIKSIPCKKKKKGFSGTFAKIKILLGDRCCTTSATSD